MKSGRFAKTPILLIRRVSGQADNVFRAIAVAKKGMSSKR